MAKIEKNNTKYIYIRFQISENKVNSFGRMYKSATKADFLNSLKGISSDLGVITATCALEISTDANISGMKDLANAINMIFIKLFDFYPTFSEKPSIMQIAEAESFIDSQMAIAVENILPIRS
ncbi:MAG TPA: hypothetical protein VLS94_09660, partial [Fusibacter sp.]|nr:hypothetical protein [Fusibacter sp.]